MINNGLLKKGLITVAFLIFFRILAYVPVPGVDPDVIKQIFDSQAGGLLQMANMFSGSSIERFSIISLGIMPYITASILMELAAATYAPLGKMKKEKEGVAKYMLYIRYATITIASIQAVGISIGLFVMSGDKSLFLIDKNLFIVLAALTMVTGTMILLWIGEQITQRGIGNGISLIIVSGIASGIPAAILQTSELLGNGGINFIAVIGVFAIIVATVLIIIFIELGERRIPIQNARRSAMEMIHGSIENYIPIKINISGLIPPIFASAILILPMTFLNGSTNEYVKMVADSLNPSGFLHNALMFLFVVFFAYFYTSIAFNSKDISDGLKKQDSYINGIRPGHSTEEYLNTVVGKLTFFGAIYLAIISTAPFLLIKAIGVPFYFGGPAVLIVVQVSIDTIKKIMAERSLQAIKTTNISKL